MSDSPTVRGNLPVRIAKSVLDRLAIHEDESKADRIKLLNGEQPDRIEPLK